MGIDRNYFVQWATLVVLLLFMGGAVTSSLLRDYHRIVQGEKDRLLGQAEIISDNVTENLKITDGMLKLFSDKFARLPKSRWGNVTMARELALTLKLTPELRTLIVFDMDGTIRVATRSDIAGKNIAFRNYYKKIKNNPQDDILYISKPFKSLLNKWVLTFGRVIPGHRGKPAGVVMAVLDSSYVRTLLASVAYSPDMWASICHSSGVRFIRVPVVLKESPEVRHETDAILVKHLKSGKRSSIIKDVLPVTGEPRLTAIMTINPQSVPMDFPLVCSVCRDYDAVMAPWYDTFYREGGRFLIVVIASILFMALFQRRQRKYQIMAEVSSKNLKESARRLEQATDASRLFIWEYDTVTEQLYLDDGLKELLGIDPDSPSSELEHIREMFKPEDVEFLNETYSMLDAGNYTFEKEMAFIRDNEEMKILHLKAKMYHSEKSMFNQLVGICEDITEKKQNEQQVKKIFHGIENSAAAVLITDRSGVIEYVNQKFMDITGYTREEILGENPSVFKSNTTSSAVFSDLWKTILSGRQWKGELKNRRKNGEIYWSLTSISPLADEHGNITHFIANIEDINDRKDAEMMIEKLAYYDPLTNLPNRRMFNDRLELGIMRSKRSNSLLALMYFDLDRFKNVNDSLGHSVGDQLLIAMAERYREALQDDDILARIGGDEFAVIFHDQKSEHEIAHMAQRFVELTSKPVHVGGTEITIGVSVGISLFPRDAQTGEDLVKLADIALYHAKDSKKQTYSFFSDELNQEYANRMKIEEGLRYALQRQELRMVYQPQVELSTGKLHGVEALLRWKSSEFGQIDPETTIRIAEEIGIINSLGDWILRSACRQQVLWKEQGCDIHMAVNLSSVQFMSPHLVDTISGIMVETGIEPEMLELELTESVLVDDPPSVSAKLQELRDLGCSIAIDDFGTGYSSMNYLKNFPLTVLKIDKSFTMEVEKSKNDRAIVQTIISLAENLGLETVAEGVENEFHREFLSSSGCTYAQGYLYSKPVDQETIVELFRSFMTK